MSLIVFQSLLNNDVAIERRQRTPDGQGGWAIGYLAGDTVRGRIRPASSSEREVAQLEERQITHVLYVLAGTDIERGDRVTVGDLVVEVEAIREPSKAGEHLEIDCRERQVEVASEEVGS
jgi:SPP1 family predicted phage head-tail adaptor